MAENVEREQVMGYLAGVGPKNGNDLIDRLVVCRGCGAKGVREVDKVLPRGWFNVTCQGNVGDFLRATVCSPRCAGEVIRKVCGE